MRHHISCLIFLLIWACFTTTHKHLDTPVGAMYYSCDKGCIYVAVDSINMLICEQATGGETPGVNTRYQRVVFKRWILEHTSMDEATYGRCRYVIDRPNTRRWEVPHVPLQIAQLYIKEHAQTNQINLVYQSYLKEMSSSAPAEGSVGWNDKVTMVAQFLYETFGGNVFIQNGFMFRWVHFF